MSFIFMRGNEIQWIFNSDSYSLVFAENSLQKYFLCAYHLRREGLTNSSAKRQDYSKARESPGLKRIFLDVYIFESKEI